MAEGFQGTAPLVAAAAVAEAVVAHGVTGGADGYPFGIEVEVLPRLVSILVRDLASSSRVEVDHGGDVPVVQHLVDGVVIVGGVENGDLDPPPAIKLQALIEDNDAGD